SAAREAEHALGDDVALDLRRAGVDRLGLRPHPAVLPAPVLDREGRLRREGAVHALDSNRRLLHSLVHLAPVQLGHARLWAGRVTVLRAREVAQADEPEDVRLDLSLRDLLPGRRIRPHAPLSRQQCQLGYDALEARG